ncbi:MAG: hypothetical protein B7Y39_13275 [Bdellovibrio sp. 28-41-41]|nr:MAG: hypothetical protein B7Y39_13275 [Bdellovibrio sp. 28-41-41]
MTKFVFLLAMGLMIGCSNASKKASTETATGPSTVTTPATTTAAATVETKKEDTKKSKTKSAATKTAGDAKTAAEVTCTSKQEVRKLSIKAKDQGCELEYTKGGQPTSVASQVAGQAKCEEVSTRIKEKLVAAGYTCE